MKQKFQNSLPRRLRMNGQKIHKENRGRIERKGEGEEEGGGEGERG